MTRLMAQIIDSNGDVCFTALDNSSSIEIDGLDRGNLDDVVNWGIMSNRGKIVCDDYDDTFYYLYRANPSMSGFKVAIFVTNGTHTNKVATFFVDDVLYNENSKKIEIELQDGLTKWQDKQISLNISSDQSTLMDLLNSVATLMLSVHKLKITATQRASTLLQKIKIQCPYRKETVKVWSIVNEICAISMCRVFANANGDACIDYDVFESYPIAIRSYDTIDVVRTSSQHKNTIPSARISVTDRLFYSEVELVKPPVAFLFATYDMTYDELSKFSGTTSNQDTYDISVDTFDSGSIELKRASVSTLRSLPIVSNMTAAKITQKLISGVRKENGALTVDNNLIITNFKENLSGNTMSFEFEVPTAAQRTFSATVQTGEFFYERLIISVWGSAYKDSDEEYSFGDTSLSNAVSLNTSPWLQTLNTVDGEEHAEWMLRNISKRYANGVECLEITCIMDDYYYDKSNVIAASGISTNNVPTLFERYSSVVPYVMRNGVEQPYSTNADGTAKSYIVVGYKYQDSGHLTQKLYLQEKTF